MTNTKIILILIALAAGKMSFAQDFPSLPETTMLQRLQPPEGKVNVVIDTDTYNEIDDQFAVIYALLSPEKLNVEAIYAAPFLNSRSESAGDGMLKSHEELLRLLDKIDVEDEGLVFQGSRSFLDKPGQAVESEAAKDLVKRAMSAEGPLYVLTLGAPTNVASAILMEPRIINKIVVVWLGGKGLNWNTASEFNLKQDLIASKLLFDSGVPLIQLPTEPVTSHLRTSLPEIESHLEGQGAIGDYLVQIFKTYRKDHFGRSKVIWDISAIAYVINSNWFRTELRSSPVLTDQLTYSFDSSRHFYRVATYVYRDQLFRDMFQKIQRANAVPVIFDTDIGGDYDDVGAIGMLHALADSGEVEILATIASNLSPQVVPCIDAINSYFGRPDLPIGAPKGKGVYQDSRELDWPDSLLANYPHRYNSTAEAPDATTVYRRVLARQPDTSVTIVTVGFLTNLQNLLMSGPDSISALNGRELVKKKVKRWVAMAGKFPKGKETNVRRDSSASRYVIDHWPTPILFSGYEIGHNVLTGLRLISDGPPDSPIRLAYALSIPKRAFDRNGRRSYDQTALLVAVRGIEPYYTAKTGRFIPYADGSNGWEDDPAGNHRHLVERMDPDSVAYEIERLMMHAPLTN